MEMQHIDKMQLFIWTCINTQFNIVMVIGNVIYYNLEKDMISWCNIASATFQQLRPIAFHLIIIGYAQLAYHVAI